MGGKAQNNNRYIERCTEYNSEAPGNEAHAANGLFPATKGVQLGELSRIAFRAQ